MSQVPGEPADAAPEEEPLPGVREPGPRPLPQGAQETPPSTYRVARKAEGLKKGKQGKREEAFTEEKARSKEPWEHLFHELGPAELEQHRRVLQCDHHPAKLERAKAEEQRKQKKWCEGNKVGVKID